jgi:hypothetical protein
MFLTLAAATPGGPALAHEKGGNASGTVESIAADRIVVKTSDGHAVAFAVTKETRFLRGARPTRADDVRVGERVVVHGSRNGDGLSASEVKLGFEPAPK